ncbi:hypothetical protein NDU88_000784, partial [Pleurodeles waltl]
RFIIENSSASFPHTEEVHHREEQCKLPSHAGSSQTTAVQAPLMHTRRFIIENSSASFPHTQEVHHRE